MMNTQQIFKLLLLAGIVIYFIQSFCLLISIYPKQGEKRILHYLNKLTPNFSYLTDISDKHLEPNPKQLDRFIKYYKFLNNNHINTQDSNEVLALCYFYNDQKDRAMDLYKESIRKHPLFFWSHYNLGLIYLSQRNWTKAEESFKNAIAVPEKSTIEHLALLPSYRPYLINKYTLEDLILSIQQGHEHSLIFLEQLKAYTASTDPIKKEAISESLLKNIHPKIF